MRQICYNYSCTNRIKQPWDVEASPRPLHQKGEFLMQPQFIILKGRAKNLTGQRFGRLVALGAIGRLKNKQLAWLCQCDCGKTATVPSSNLQTKNTQSCGCLCRDTSRQTLLTHGMTNHKIYALWSRIINRCTNPRADGYIYYGARGISIFGEWRSNFKAFYDYVSCLENYEKQDCTLDRIDNDRNYEPGNVRWATKTEQMRNTRINRMLTHNGKTQCVAAWAEEKGINIATLWRRLKGGWSIERALTKPVRRRAAIAASMKLDGDA